jgi:hypothetical protein
VRFGTSTEANGDTRPRQLRALLERASDPGSGEPLTQPLNDLHGSYVLRRVGVGARLSARLEREVLAAEEPASPRGR